MQTKPKQRTRNQKRKEDYAKLAEEQKESRSAKRARLARKRRARSVASHGAHVRPCGNPACRTCYVRTKKGIVNAYTALAQAAAENAA